MGTKKMVNFINGRKKNLKEQSSVASSGMLSNGTMVLSML